MKKSILLMFLISMCPCLTSCTFVNCWAMKGAGKGVKGGYQVATGQAENVEAIFARTLLITTRKVDKVFLEGLPNVKLATDLEGKTKSVEIGGKNEKTNTDLVVQTPLEKSN